MQNNKQAPEKLKISLNSSLQSDAIENDVFIDESLQMVIESCYDDTEYDVINDAGDIINTESIYLAEIEQVCDNVENMATDCPALPVPQNEFVLNKEYLENYKNTIIEEMTKKFELSDFEDRKKTKQKEFDNLENLILVRKEALNDISQKIELLRNEWVYGCKKAIDDLINSSLIEFECKILNT